MPAPKKTPDSTGLNDLTHAALQLVQRTRQQFNTIQGNRSLANPFPDLLNGDPTLFLPTEHRAVNPALLAIAERELSQLQEQLSAPRVQKNLSLDGADEKRQPCMELY